MFILLQQHLLSLFRMAAGGADLVACSLPFFPLKSANKTPPSFSPPTDSRETLKWWNPSLAELSLINSPGTVLRLGYGMAGKGGGGGGLLALLETT